jgi:hypothetical protein
MLFSTRLRYPPNAAHHAPAGSIEFDEMTRVAGRVHAVVRLRLALARLPPPGPLATMRAPRHSSRRRPAPLSGRPPRPATPQPSRLATRRSPRFQFAKGYIAPAI